MAMRNSLVEISVLVLCLSNGYYSNRPPQNCVAIIERRENTHATNNDDIGNVGYSMMVFVNSGCTYTWT